MKSIWERRQPSFGFVSTRFAGTDGVSLETAKWCEVLESRGCTCFFYAGQLDRDPGKSFASPKAFFQHPEILEIQDALFTTPHRTPEVSARVHELKEELKADLYAFHERFSFDILVVQNALAIPVNVPLGLALTEFIVESGLPTIAHHHDFYWERQRFNSWAARDYLFKAFPCDFPNVHHVVINSLAGRQMARRTGARWTLIPNVLDFKSLPEPDGYADNIREDLGLSEDDVLILQPTRVVQRKGIETAVELVRRLDLPNAVLVISHEAGDEGMEYQKRIEDFAEFMGVDLRIVADRISDHRGTGPDGEKIYTLWDLYPHADLVTYPSTYEGYGNAFVEAIYFRKPVVVNRYAIFEADIEPLGFDVVAFNQYLTDQTLEDVRSLLASPDQRTKMAETNYMLGWRYLSYELLEEKLEGILVEIYGS